MGFSYGVIDFKGNVVIPFTKSVEDEGSEAFELHYNEKENAFSSPYRTYTTAWKKLDYTKTGWRYVNGYIRAIKQGAYIGAESYAPTTVFFVKADGSSLNLTQKLGWSVKEGYYPGYQTSDFSVGGYVWVQNKNRTKWGLIDFSGKTILPFEFDNVDYEKWALAENGHAIVEKGGMKGLVNAEGKLVIPCSYKYINTTNQSPMDFGVEVTSSPTVGIENENGKQGIAEIKTGKILLPCEYDSIGAYRGEEQIRSTLFEMGVYYAKRDGMTCLVDKNGRVVYSTNTVSFKEAVDGLYWSEEGKMDNRGRIIIPESLNSYEIMDDFDSYTIYIKDGKVYRASANYFASTFGYKPSAPEKATASPSSVKFLVDGKSVAVDAYLIGGNNYIKLRDLATMVNHTGKNFEVTWDGSKNVINLLSNKTYTSVGGEMAKGDGKAKTATRTNSRIFVNGSEVSLTAYTIGGSNYFKLRDVMQIFDIGVGWDGATATATINTNEAYALTAYEQNKFNELKKAYDKAYEEEAKRMAKKEYEDANGLKQVHSKPFGYLPYKPYKLEYRVGETFEPRGLGVYYVDIYDRYTEVTSMLELKVNSTKIYQGYQFKEAGRKRVDCYYNGEVLVSFEINVRK